MGRGVVLIALLAVLAVLVVPVRATSRACERARLRTDEDFLNGDAVIPSDITGPVLTKEVYVNVQLGNDSAACGDVEHPCQSLAHALAVWQGTVGVDYVLSDGQVFHVDVLGGGLYTSSVNLAGAARIRGASAQAPPLINITMVPNDLGVPVSSWLVTKDSLELRNVRLSVHSQADEVTVPSLFVANGAFDLPTLTLRNVTVSDMLQGIASNMDTVVVDRCVVRNTFMTLFHGGSRVWIGNSVFRNNARVDREALTKAFVSGHHITLDTVRVADALQSVPTRVTASDVPEFARVAGDRGMLHMRHCDVINFANPRTTLHISFSALQGELFANDVCFRDAVSVGIPHGPFNVGALLTASKTVQVHDVAFVNITMDLETAVPIPGLRARSSLYFIWGRDNRFDRLTANISDILIEHLDTKAARMGGEHVLQGLVHINGPSAVITRCTDVTVTVRNVVARHLVLFDATPVVFRGMTSGVLIENARFEHLSSMYLYTPPGISMEAFVNARIQFDPVFASITLRNLSISNVSFTSGTLVRAVWCNVTIAGLTVENIGFMTPANLGPLFDLHAAGVGFVNVDDVRFRNVTYVLATSPYVASSSSTPSLLRINNQGYRLVPHETRVSNVYCSDVTMREGIGMHSFDLTGDAVVENIVVERIHNFCDVDPVQQPMCGYSGLFLESGHFQVRNFTCQDNIARVAACIAAQSTSVVVHDSRFVRNSAEEGGVVVPLQPGVVEAQRVTMRNCEFERNTAQTGGVVFAEEANTMVEIDGCLFLHNTAELGGAIALQGMHERFVVRDSRFVGNVALAGGAIHMTNSISVLLHNNVFERCRSGIGGAALFVRSSLSTMSLVEVLSCRFLANELLLGGKGGAIRIEGEPQHRATIAGCHFEGNDAEGTGSAISILVRSPAHVANCTFVNNQGASGTLTVSALATPKVENCTFEGNEAIEGGALHLDTGSVSHIEGCSFVHNHASGRGGGVLVENVARATFRNCVWMNNTADQEGGALKVSWSADVVVEGLSRMVYNAADSGGAVHADLEAHVLLDEVLLAFNDARRGGAVTVDDDAWIEMHAVDVRNNTAGHGGGVLLSRWRHAFLHTCVFFGNSAFAKGGAVSIHRNTEPVNIQSCRFEFNDVTGSSAFDRNGGAAVYTQSPSVRLWDAYAVGNVAPYGAGVFVDVNLASDVSILNATFDMNRATFGGGAVYWQVEGNGNDRKAPLVVQRDETRTHNTARYGRDMATSPQSLAFSSVPPSHLMGGEEDVVLHIEVRDHDNNRVDTDVFTDSYEVEMVVPAGIIVYGPKRIVSKEGIATFSFRIDGEVGTHVMKFRPLNHDDTDLSPTFWTLALTPCAQGKRKVRLADGVPVCQFCPQGSYVLKRNATQECLPCPVGADCAGNSVIAERGYWLYEDPDGSVVSYTCEVNKCKLAQPDRACGNNCTVANQCAEHRHGRLCSGCEEGYQTVAWASGCIPCDHVRVGAIVGVVIAMWLFVLFQHFFVSQSAATVKLVFYYIQVSEVLTAGLPVTGGAAFNVMNFRGAMGVCLAPMSYYTRFLLVALTPFMLLVMLAITFGVHWAYVQWKRRRIGPHIERAVDGYVEFEGGRTGVQRVRIDAYIKTLWALGLFSYAPLTYEALGFFQCGHVGGENVMQSNPHIVCDTEMYRDYVGLAAVLVVWAVAFPIAVVVQMQRLRGHFHEEAVIRRFSILFGGFRVRQWQAFSIVRLTILISVSTAHFSSSEGRHLALASLCFFIFCVHAQVQPYEQEWLNRLEMWVLFMLTLVSFCVSFPSYYIEHTYLHVLTVTVPIALLAMLAVGVQQRKFATKLRLVRQKRLGSDPGAGTALREASSSD